MHARPYTNTNYLIVMFHILRCSESMCTLKLRHGRIGLSRLPGWINTLAAHLLEWELQEGDRPKTLVICDNLHSHVFGGFLEGRLKCLGAERNLLIAGETEVLQAIDGGIWSILQMLIGQVLSAKRTQHTTLLCNAACTHTYTTIWLNCFTTTFKI